MQSYQKIPMKEHSFTKEPGNPTSRLPEEDAMKL